MNRIESSSGTPPVPPGNVPAPPTEVRSKLGSVAVIGALIAGVLAVVLLVEVLVMAGAWTMHRQGAYEDEIRWLEGARPVIPWDPGLDAQLDKLYADRIERELRAGRIMKAVIALRQARARTRSLGRKPEPRFISLGVETFTRAADYVERLGQLSRAADWDDSLFVLAVRADDARYRAAAVAAFTEGLDLRLRDGKPCAALARIEWARKGLGGEIPGMQAGVEQDIVQACRDVSR